MKSIFRIGRRIAACLSPAFVAVVAIAASNTAFAQGVFINEFHYDNAGTDTGEAIELAGPAGTDLTGWEVVLYNGSNGQVYRTEGLSGLIPDIDSGFGMVVINLPTNGLQNGSPDGIALVNGGTVEQFLSYEGSFTAIEGPATGMLSTDIGVAEASSTPAGYSLQLTGTGTTAGDFTWAAAQPNTFGATNAGQTFASADTAFINELHYDNAGADAGEQFEIAGNAGLDLSGWSVVLYNGNGGSSYGTINLAGVIPDQDNGYGTLAFARSGIQNGSPDGLALVNGTDVVEFLSYEGSFTANDGPAAGMTSTDIGVSEPGSTAVGDSLQLTGAGNSASDFTWAAAQPNTFGSVNTGQSFADIGPPPSLDFVINEIHADPASGLPGDANGDGIRNFSDDEFVELVNTSASDIDVSGWTLADGASIRHTFPAGSIVESGCSVVVFGGNTPTGEFGASLVQIASSGALGLNNSGDTVTLSDGSISLSTSYGGAGGNNQSLTLEPDVTGTSYVQHSTASGSGGTLFSPGTRADGSQFPGCEVLPQGPLAIHEIQGSGTASPYNGVLVFTTSNVVTAVGPEGFAMQTPAGLEDATVDTSEGIYVYTDSTPTVAAGDLVVVTGLVREFFDLTEITGNPNVEVVGGSTPPAPVVFDENVPSPSPALPSCAIEFECYEGMLVQVTGGTVGASNLRFNVDPVAEVTVTAAGKRPFREPGVEFPGLAMPPIATWDGNPEIFELDPDKLGLPNQIIPAGSHFNATGIIGFEFGDYELWPSSLTVFPADIPSSVRDRQRAELTVGSLNMFRLFDDVDDPGEPRADGETRNDWVASTAEYDRRRAKFVSYIIDVLKAPDILAVQEVEKLGVLEDLAADMAAAGVNYTAYVEEGNDIGTIDVGFLVRDTMAVDAITQINKDEILAFDGSLLHDRPPLLLEGRSTNEGADYPIAVMVVHNRSLSRIDDPSDGERVRAKRLAQAESIAQSINDLQTADPGIRLVVIGDFNAFQFSDGYVDSVGIISGLFDPDASLVPGTDYVEPDLINLTNSVPESERYSFVFRGSAQALDHALTSMSLDMSFRGLEYGRGNADAAVDLINDDTTPLRSSDHDGLVLFITKDVDGDGVNDDADVCPATSIPEAPTEGLGRNRFALIDGDFEFDTVESKGKGPGRGYSTIDTAGCSCAQIVEAEGLGKGHSKFGCSIGVMDNWVRKVSM
ncbi:MAG: lamin tail domain-containing protein [Gammaproteobacteria bacterium]|nr:lamin tail domain-containing protein [Gammaproteobacteria bacterium]